MGYLRRIEQQGVDFWGDRLIRHEVTVKNGAPFTQTTLLAADPSTAIAAMPKVMVEALPKEFVEKHNGKKERPSE